MEEVAEFQEHCQFAMSLSQITGNRSEGHTRELGALVLDATFASHLVHFPKIQQSSLIRSARVSSCSWQTVDCTSRSPEENWRSDNSTLSTVISQNMIIFGTFKRNLLSCPGPREWLTVLPQKWRKELATTWRVPSLCLHGRMKPICWSVRGPSQTCRNGFIRTT